MRGQTGMTSCGTELGLSERLVVNIAVAHRHIITYAVVIYT